MSEDIDADWVKRYIAAKQLPSRLESHRSTITKFALEAFVQYKAEMDKGEYKHLRFGSTDIDTFISELSGYSKDELSRQLVEKIAFYSMA